jgi:hypothetical protein
MRHKPLAKASLYNLLDKRLSVETRAAAAAAFAADSLSSGKRVSTRPVAVQTG